MGARPIKAANGVHLWGGGEETGPTPLGDQCRHFIKELEQALRAFQRDAPPEAFNFLLKSQAAVIYRLALERGIAAEIADIIRDPLR